MSVSGDETLISAGSGQEEFESTRENQEQVVPMVLQRSRRDNAGNKLKQLLDEEIEGGDDFYNQDFFREEDEDSDFVESPQDDDDDDDNDQEEDAGDGDDTTQESDERSEHDDDEDVFDEDFPSPEEEARMVEEEDAAIEQRRILEESQTERKRKRGMTHNRRQTSSDMSSARRRMDSRLAESNHRSKTIEPGVGHERTVAVRSSTVAKTRQIQTRIEVKQQLSLLRSEKFAHRQLSREPIVWTQEARLAETPQTEALNLASLEDLRRIEIEMKKLPKPYRDASGPRIVYRSSCDEGVLMEFRAWSQDPFESWTTVPEPRSSCCPITGLPAKYREPITGLPCATKEAYQQLRDRIPLDERKNRVTRTSGKLTKEERWSRIVRYMQPILAKEDHSGTVK